MKINSNENKRCELYLKQEKKINKYYSDKKNAFKNYIDENIKQFKNKIKSFQLFYSIVTQYNEIIQKNLENLQKIFFNKNPNIQYQDPILVELIQILTCNYECEEEKCERLNSILKDKNTFSDYEKKGKEAITIINTYYYIYINLIDLLNTNHISYLRLFNDFEIKMIIDETKETKEIEKENFAYSQIKENELLVSLHNKEFEYKSILESTNNELKIIYNEVDKNIEELKKINKEINDLMESLLTTIYFGFLTSNKMHKIYEKKILNLKQSNSEEIINNININKTNKEIKTNEEKVNSELGNILQSMEFQPYNLLSPFANIVGYKQHNKILEKLKPETIYKISFIINSEFHYISKVDLKEQYQIMDVKLISQRILQSTTINQDEEEQLYHYLEERKYMLAFLAALNKTRSAGKFRLKKKSIIILGKAYKIIVDKLYKENNIDFEILKYLIIMSQTYYAIGTNQEEKIYLIRFIEDSPYFKSEKLWNTYISEVIERELEHQNSGNIWSLESEESEEYKMSQIFFGIFIGHAQNIMEFQLEKQLVYKIIHNLINTKYNISEEFIKQIDALIENTKYEKKTKLNPEKDILE